MNKYSYFQYTITEYCHDLRIVVQTTLGEVQASVGKFPNMYPSPSKLNWHLVGGDTELNIQNLTIYHWDPEFELGTFYISVVAGASENAFYNITIYDEIGTKS